MNFDFDAALKGLIDLVEASLQKTREDNEHHFEWLLCYHDKARERLNSGETEVFKMPKTPGRKKTRQQKKRVLGEDDDTVNGNHVGSDNPVKKGKLSTEEDDLRESLGVARPRRQASNAAKNKIQQNLKMFNLQQKLRRPSGKDTSISQENGNNQVQNMECSPVIQKVRSKVEINETIIIKPEEVSPTHEYRSVIQEVRNPPSLKVNFAPESSNTVRHIENSEDLGCSVLTGDNEEAANQVSEESEKTDKSKEEETKPPVAQPVQAEPPKKTRTTRKTKKTENIVEDKVDSGTQQKSELDTKQIAAAKLPVTEEKEIAQPIVEETKETIKEPEPKSKITAEVEAVPKKKTTRKPRKVQEETQKAAPPPPPIAKASPRVTRNQTRTSTSSVVPNSPRVDKTPSKKNVPDQPLKGIQYQSPRANSPIKRIFTPKQVFSPFKPSSVKTKVEAFEAVLNNVIPTQSVQHETQNVGSKEQIQPILPEARVLLRRLTSQELTKAGAKEEKPDQSSKTVTQENLKRGTFVLEVSEDEKSSPEKSKEKREEHRKSVAQMLARKSVDKAKHVALAAARSKLIQNSVQEAPESPNVHVNKNAANMVSKFRFTNTSGSSGSSSASLNRHIAMTSARTPSNIVTGVGTFIGSKPIAPSVTKATEEEEMKRKELELKRLKEKEEEAARKREELLKAKAEEQKKKHEARAKRAMEQRAARAKQIDQEVKHKLETKEEKTANMKLKLQAEHQEKTERARVALLQRQQEAEQRRKAEELQKQREWEEEQQRLLAAKKEQEELERQAKIKLAEAEKARVEAERAKAEADRIKAEAEKAKAAATAVAPSTSTTAPPKLNTTVTLSNTSYQITPVRVTKMGKIFNPDNYDISDMRSDDSTDDDSRPKKQIPDWARSSNLKTALVAQHKAKIDVDEIFPPETLLREPDLNVIFKIKRARFDKRTSSAVWKTPPAHYLY